MTTPSIVPTSYSGTDKDYLIAPGTRDGTISVVAGAVSVPSATAATTVVGLFPFQKGATFHAPTFHVGDLTDNSGTLDFGIVYDDNSGNTNDVDLFASLSTAGRAGGYVTLDEVAWLNYVTTANGWVVVTLNTSAADATVNVTFNVGVQYGAKIIA